MVRALLAGTKTQTRRLMPGQEYLRQAYDPIVSGTRIYNYAAEEIISKAPISVGDRLWCRETWSGVHSFRDTPPSLRQSVMTQDGPILRDDIWFWADGNPDGGDYERPRPGIHMPRWSSRLTLTVTDVRVQRLQDISEDDARAEGCPFTHDGRQYDPPAPDVDSWQGYGRASFCLLWDSINGAGSWEANPWVAAYTFTVEKRNIDA